MRASYNYKKLRHSTREKNLEKMRDFLSERQVFRSEQEVLLLALDLIAVALLDEKQDSHLCMQVLNRLFHLRSRHEKSYEYS